jgi:hypothetical protein
MMWLAFVVVALVFAGVLVARRQLSRRALIGAGIAFALAGLVPVAALEWYFSAARTTPVNMAVPMDRAGTVHAGPFRIAIGGEYEMWLVFDHTDAVADFDCWIGYHDMEAECPRGAPPLDLAWRVTAEGVPMEAGGRPRLVIGLSAAATKGLGTVVTILALLWVLAGGVLVLLGIARKAPR